MKRKLTQAGVMVIIAALVCSIAIAKKRRDKKVSLPAQVEKSLTESYPDASIKEVNKEEEEFKVFEVELALKNGQEVEVTVTGDGTVMEAENEIEVSALPFDVLTIIPSGGEIKEVKSEVTYAVLAPVALAQPKTTYELEAVVDGQEVELKVAADGTVLSRETKDKNDDGDDDDNDDGDD